MRLSRYEEINERSEQSENETTHILLLLQSARPPLLLLSPLPSPFFLIQLSLSPFFLDGFRRFLNLDRKCRGREGEFFILRIEEAEIGLGGRVGDLQLSEGRFRR